MKYTLALLMIALLAGCAGMGTGGNADVVKVDSNGRTYLNGELVSVTFLSTRLKKDKVVIDAHPVTAQATLSAIRDQAKRAGVKDVSLKGEEKKTKDEADE